MQRWLGKSLKRKLSVILLGSILFPLLSLGYVLYNVAALEAEEKTKQASTSILEQIQTNLEFILQDAEDMSIFLIGQEDIQRYLAKPQADSSLQITIMGFLSNLVYSKKYISNISIYPNNGNHALSNTTIFTNGLITSSENKLEQDQQHKRWTSLYTNITTNGEERVLSLLRPIGSMTTYKSKGTLSISINERVLAQFMTPSRIASQGYVLMVDDQGTIISGGKRDMLMKPVSEALPLLPEMKDDQGFINAGQGSDKLTIVYKRIPEVDWTLLAVIPYEQFHAQSRYVLTLTAVAVGLAMMIMAGFILFLVQHVTKPLHTLAQSLKDFQPEDQVVTLPVHSSDEVGMLIHSYNRLYERIQRLMNEVQRNEGLKKEADMLALQAQMNPHFLYNTLASIHWLALMNKDTRIADMVGSLSDFLRFSLNKGSEYCTIKQEVEHAKHYGFIQKLRYPNQFELEFRVPPALEQHVMVKLLVQPLIENAIIHGIMKKQEPGYISVTVEALDDQYIQFIVEDSGLGIPSERLQLIRAELAEPMEQNSPTERKESYGLRNVHQRLRLHYGTGTGLTIESTEGHGTQVSFIIPYKEEA